MWLNLTIALHLWMKVWHKSAALCKPPLNPCPVVLFCAAFIWECEGED